GLAEEGGRGAEGDEDQRKAEDEAERGERRAAVKGAAAPSLGAQGLEGRPAHIAEIGRHQGQHAGAEKTQDTGAENHWQLETEHDAFPVDASLLTVWGGGAS